MFILKRGEFSFFVALEMLLRVFALPVFLSVMSEFKLFRVLCYFTIPFFLSASCLAKPRVVATFSILGDMVHEIAQDKVELKTLVGPNQDSHVYEPRPQDVKELAQADLVVVNGLGFEGWMDRLIKASGFKGRIVTATQGISPLMNTARGNATVDPHAWHSLQNAQVYVKNIVKALSALLPLEASYFKARGRAYKKSLERLKDKMNQKLSSVPFERRKVITNHRAFGYLGREFGITFISPLGISTDAEPSAKGIAMLIRQIQTENIQAIFIENISNPRMIEQIANETGNKISGILYSDALSAPGMGADTYLKMMSFNLSSLVKALRKDEITK